MAPGPQFRVTIRVTGDLPAVRDLYLKEQGSLRCVLEGNPHAALVRSELRILGKVFLVVPKEEFDRLSQDAACSAPGLSDFGAVKIGRRLREARRRAGLTQVDLARRSGIRPETLSRLENGHGNSTLGTVEAIQRALRGS